MGTDPPATFTERGHSSRWLVLATCCTSLFMVGLDNTIVNVALPSISRSLDASLSGLQWVVDAYTLVLASFLMVSGSVADAVGRRRVFRAGLVIFTGASLLCSLAPSLGALIGFRMLKAFGGSMLNPVAMSIIRNTFTDARERAFAIGLWGAVSGMSIALGPVVGGLLVEGVGWRSIFWINVPIGIGSLALADRFIRESRALSSRRLDPAGHILTITCLASLTYALIEGHAGGWFSAEIVSLFVLSASAAVAFLWYERRAAEPFIELGFFRSAPFSGATLIAVSSYAALGGFLFVNTLYLQMVRGLAPFRAGMYMLPIAALLVIASPLSGRLVGRQGPRLSLVIGGLGITAGGLLLAGLRADTAELRLIAAYAVFGLGIGMVNPPITNTAVTGMPAAQAGLAAAIASTSRQIGQTLGVAIVGAVTLPRLDGQPLRTAFASASHPVWWIVVGCGLFVVVVALVTTTPWAAATAARTAKRYGGTAELLPA